MNQKHNALAHTQLADTSSALNDYFDVLLHDVVDIDTSTVNETAANNVTAESTQKNTSAFVIEGDEPSSTDTKSALVEQKDCVAEESTEVSKPLESDGEALPKANEQQVAEATAIEVVSTESKEAHESRDIDCDDAEHDEWASGAIDEEDYYVEGAPDWAREPFQALEFTIAKLKLVIPLTHLCGILDWERADLTPMPGHSKHFIGVWPNHGINSKIVDVSGMVVPQRYQHKIESWRTRITKVVLIDDSAWGLACDEILGVVTLDPREVKWRSDRSHRQWLAGTLVEHMSALVDGDQFAATLLHGEENESTLAS